MKNIVKFKDIIILTIGTLLVILSICLIMYDKFILLRDNVYGEIELEKYKENAKNTVYEDENEVHDGNVNMDDIDVEDIEDNDGEQVKKTETKKIQKEYIGYLQISKINLKQGLVSKKSYYNNVNRNIQILQASDYPDKENGNVILAAHSGTSAISYFKNLYKLSIGDEAKIFYKDYVYNYKIVDIYNVPKVGSINISRDTSKTCLTLITCTKNSKTEQTVYILELTSKEEA